MNQEQPLPELWQRKISPATLKDQFIVPWKLNYDSLDSSIRDIVRIINESGWTWTFTSCEGHEDVKMWENGISFILMSGSVHQQNLSDIVSIITKTETTLLPEIEISCEQKPWWQMTIRCPARRADQINARNDLMLIAKAIKESGKD